MDQLIFVSLLAAVGLFAGMVALEELGRRIGLKRLAADPDAARPGFGTIDGAVFALLGLLIAFTFSGAAARFDERRKLVVEEANAIGTAYLRLDLLAADDRAELRGMLRDYIDARMEVYRLLPDFVAAKAALDRSAALQQAIWSKSVAAAERDNRTPATMLLLPALNQMIDITTTRTMAAQMHPPQVVFILLCGLSLLCGLLAGIGMAGGQRRSWIHMVGFAAVMAVTVYVILDLEYPRMGLIQVDAVDQVLVEVRESMN